MRGTNFHVFRLSVCREVASIILISMESCAYNRALLDNAPEDNTNVMEERL